MEDLPVFLVAPRAPPHHPPPSSLLSLSGVAEKQGVVVVEFGLQVDRAEFEIHKFKRESQRVL